MKRARFNPPETSFAPNGVYLGNENNTDRCACVKKSSCARFMTDNSVHIRHLSTLEVLTCLFFLVCGIVMTFLTFNLLHSSDQQVREVTFQKASQLQHVYIADKFLSAVNMASSLAYLAQAGSTDLHSATHDFAKEKFAANGNLFKWFSIHDKVLLENRTQAEEAFTDYWNTAVDPTSDRQFEIKYQLPNKSYAVSPDNEVYYPIVYRFPIKADLMLWDTSVKSGPPDYNYTKICGPPTTATAVIEQDHPTLITCSHVIPPIGQRRVKVALRPGIVLESAMRTMFPFNEETGLPEEIGIGVIIFDSTDMEAPVFVHGSLIAKTAMLNLINQDLQSVQQGGNVMDKQEGVHGIDLIEQFEMSMYLRNYTIVAFGTADFRPITFYNNLFLSMVVFVIFLLISMGYLVFTLLAIGRRHDVGRSQVVAYNKLLGHMCHALRNPLHSILFFSSYLHAETETVCEYVKYGIDSGFKNSDDKKKLTVPDVNEFQETTTVLNATAMSLYDLINSFLDYNQLNICELSLNISKHDIVSVASQVFNQHKVVNMNRLSMELTSEFESCVLDTDVVRFRQILTNGLNNSSKLTKAGSIDMFITKDCVNNMISISIKDTGPGLMGNDSAVLFEEFEQGSKPAAVSSTIASTGLGLAISKKISVHLNGTLTLDDREPVDGVVGASFTLKLPLKDAEKVVLKSSTEAAFTNLEAKKCATPTGAIVAPMAQPEQQMHVAETRKAAIGASMLSTSTDMESVRRLKSSVEGKTSAPQSDRSGSSTDASSVVVDIPQRTISDLHVLFCEDDPCNNKVLMRMLKRLGVGKVTNFFDGEDLVEFVKNHENDDSVGLEDALPDVVFLDIVMKRLNGDEAVKYLREKGVTIPVIALTGNAMMEEISYLVSIGFDEVLTKPYSSKDISHIVQKYCT